MASTLMIPKYLPEYMTSTPSTTELLYSGVAYPDQVRFAGAKITLDIANAAVPPSSHYVGVVQAGQQYFSTERVVGMVRKKVGNYFRTYYVLMSAVE